MRLIKIECFAYPCCTKFVEMKHVYNGKLKNLGENNTLKLEERLHLFRKKFVIKHFSQALHFKTLIASFENLTKSTYLAR